MTPPSQSHVNSIAASPIDLADSQTLSSIRIPNQSPATGRARITVVLSPGVRVVIPIEPQCTNSELHAEAIRRAKQLKVPCDFDNTVLCIGSPGGTIAFGEDLVLEVSDLAKESTFYLSLVEQCSSSTVSALACLVHDI